MRRRIGQNGSVFQKSDCIKGVCQHRICPWYGRFWKDLPGQVDRERVCIPLGPVSKTTAERNLRQFIIDEGIDTAAVFTKVNSTLTSFKEQSKYFLAGIKDGSIAAKKSRDPMKPATVESYNRSVAWLNDPAKGNVADVQLADFDNDAAKKLIARMKAIKPKLSAKTMTTYFGAAQMVIASAKKNGNQLFPRTWDLHYIGLPRVKAEEQNTPSFDSKKIEAILAKSQGQFLVLGALLAGTGLRIGEALGLKVEHIINDRSTVVVEQSLWRGNIQNPKTVAANRQIDVCDELAIVLHGHIGDRTEGYLFAATNGKPLNSRNVERDWLDPILEELEIKETGLLFHSFRRFRTVHLRKNRVPWDLEKFWIGHASKDITDRYTKSSTDDLTWRKQVARRTGLGFSLPVGQLGQPAVEEIVAAVAA